MRILKRKRRKGKEEKEKGKEKKRKEKKSPKSQAGSGGHVYIQYYGVRSTLVGIYQKAKRQHRGMSTCAVSLFFLANLVLRVAGKWPKSGPGGLHDWLYLSLSAFSGPRILAFRGPAFLPPDPVLPSSDKTVSMKLGRTGKHRRDRLLKRQKPQRGRPNFCVLCHCFAAVGQLPYP